MSTSDHEFLHSALASCDKEEVEWLLRQGANPNSVNAKGSTALHIAMKNSINDEMAELLFKFCKKSMQIDAKDKLGRTPLQKAVARLMPSKVDLLLNNGAELTNFVFPTKAQFCKRYKSRKIRGSDAKLKEARNVMAVVERLEKGGYKLDRSDALTIMQVFDKFGMFQMHSDEWAELHDPFFLEFINSWDNSVPFDVPSTVCETMTRGFFRRWALEFFLELTHYQLPILCCEKIVEKLENKDLFGVCMAASDSM